MRGGLTKNGTEWEAAGKDREGLARTVLEATRAQRMARVRGRWYKRQT